MNTLKQKLLPFTHEALLAILLIALLVAAAKIDPSFITVRTQRGLYSQVWDIALLALPMTFIIITGGIDLSVGAIMALASITLGILYKQFNCPLPLACLAAITVGLLCGLLNGFFVTRIKVHPLIVTLATMSAFRGLAEGISLPNTYSDFPDNFYALAKNGIQWGFPPSFIPLRVKDAPLYAIQAEGWLFIAAAILAAILLAKSKSGRALYAIGFNETAARYSGLPVDKIKTAIYALSGLAAGIVAINVSAGQNTAKADVGTGIELDVITAVVLGGTSIFGGRGRILGTVLGVALIHETRQFVKWHYHQDEWVSVVLGILLISAVAANALLARKQKRS